MVPPSLPKFDLECLTPASAPVKPPALSLGRPLLSTASSSSARRKFSPLEDQRLRDIVTELGQNDWAAIASRLGTRCARQCRERYRNYLDPSLRRDPWSEDEDRLLFEKFSEIGPKWSLIERFFKGRSEANIKNRWAQLTAKATRGELLSEEKRGILQGLDELIAGTVKSEAPINLEDEFGIGTRELPFDWERDEYWNL
jgi:hypothetical protein